MVVGIGIKPGIKASVQSPKTGEWVVIDCTALHGTALHCFPFLSFPLSFGERGRSDRER